MVGYQQNKPAQRGQAPVRVATSKPDFALNEQSQKIKLKGSLC